MTGDRLRWFRSALLEEVRRRPGQTTKELLRGPVGGGWGRKLQALRQLVRAGLVVRTGTGRKGSPWRYYPR